MVTEDVNVLERGVQIVGGRRAGSWTGYVSGVLKYTAGGYSVGFSQIRGVGVSGSDAGHIDLKKLSPGEMVHGVGFDSADEAGAEFERIKGELFVHEWVEWVTGHSADAGVFPAEFHGAVLAGKLDALLGAADFQEERGKTAAALLLRSAYHRVRGEANVEIKADRGVVYVLNPEPVTPKRPAKPAVGACRAAVVEVGKAVRVLSVEVRHESVKGDDGRCSTRVATFVAERTTRRSRR